MTGYEWFRWVTFPIMPTHLNVVRRDVKGLIRQNRNTIKRPHILDVGGRKSPYTIGLCTDVTLLDVPQESTVQEQLHLGFTEDILKTIKEKRSNIKDLVIQDMTQSTLPEESYDAVVCIEVIEHVEADQAFVEHIAKAVKPRGWVYFTTPNGNFIKNEGPNKNPDHVRHYTQEGLQALLETYFDFVEVHYAVATGRFRVWGLKSFQLKKPIRLLKSIFGNIFNRFQSIGVEKRKDHTAHLVAICYKH